MNASKSNPDYKLSPSYMDDLPLVQKHKDVCVCIIIMLVFVQTIKMMSILAQLKKRLGSPSSTKSIKVLTLGMIAGKQTKNMSRITKDIKVKPTEVSFIHK